VVLPTGQSLARLTGQAYPSHGCACSALQRPARLDADERGGRYYRNPAAPAEADDLNRTIR
jgi:hypothetical protein